jgi:hypothetical protein
MYHMKIPTKPQGCTNLKLRQLGRMVTRHYDHYMSSVGLKNTQYALLSHIVKLGPIRPGDLAKRMQMDASTLTRNLQPMAAQLALNERFGMERVLALHDLLDSCMASLDEKSSDATTV